LLANPKRAVTAARFAVMLTRPRPAGLRLARDLTSDERRAVAAGLLELEGLTISFERAGIHWTTELRRDGIGYELLTMGGFQVDDTDRLVAWIDANRPGRRVVVDVGANIGTTAVPFALAGYDVLAIEPVPATFELLERNVADNGLGSRITCVRQAITSQPGPVEMVLAGSMGQSELAVDRPGFLADGYDIVDRVEVMGGPLGALLEEHGVAPADVALVWSDVQGAELEVITTAAALWDVGVPLFVEVWPDGLDAHGGVAEFLAEVARVFTSVEVDGAPWSMGRFADEVLSIEAGAGHIDALLHREL
jgi:FkbM family methyltransferase